MPHEIDMSRGIAAMAYAGKTPWHNLGKKFDELMTSQQALHAAQLDFRVDKVPVQYDNGTSIATLDNQYVTVRTDTGAGLGVVGEGYKPVQNVEAFDFMDSLIASGDMRYETAGALSGGQRVWMLAKLPKSTSLSCDDVIDHYLLLSNSHDGHKSCSVGFTTVRVVCNNTLSVAVERLRHEYKIRHSGSILSKLAEAQNVLGLAKQAFSTFTSNAQRLTFKTYRREDVSPFLDFVFGIEKPTERTRNDVIVQDQIAELLETGAGADLSTAKGTYWGLLNAVTEWVDHAAPQRANGRTEEQLEESRFDKITWRGGNAIKQRAYTHALELAGV